MKKLVCAVLALLLVFAPGCAKDAEPDILSGYNVVRYDERDSLSAQDCLRSILVLTEEEALSCGEQVKDFLESASLVYVLSSKSSSELARACGISLSVGCDDEGSGKIATAITKGMDGTYQLRDISAVFLSEAMTAQSLSEETKIHDALAAILKNGGAHFKARRGRLEASRPFRL